MEHHDSLLSAWTNSFLTTCSPACIVIHTPPKPCSRFLVTGLSSTMAIYASLFSGDCVVALFEEAVLVDVVGRDLLIPYGVGDCPWSNLVVRPCSLLSLLPHLLTRFLCLLQSTLQGLRQTVLDSVMHARVRTEFMKKPLLLQVLHICCAHARERRTAYRRGSTEHGG